jgi:hypothetical protein
MMLLARRLALVLFACVLVASPRAHAAEVASWPHTVTGDDGSATIYTPQAISWPDLHTLTARAAVAITPEGAQAPFFGTIELSVTTDADLTTRTVTLTAPKLISTNFPTLDADHVAKLEERVRALMATLPPKEIPLDTVLLSLKQPPPTPDLPVKNDPPHIFYEQKPASLVVFDGAPLLAPIAGTGLSFAVNTNWDVLKDGAGHWYLLNNGTWFTAPDATGPWSVTTSLPADFTRVPADENFAALRRALPARAPAAGAPVPTILVSTEPAEIIVTEGAPKLAPIAGTPLQRVTNTAATLLFDPESKQFFVLLSGRWFAAASLDGPWHYATPSLPASFASIPATSPVGAVLPSVPGTPQAQEAVIQAQIPHQATLKRSASITIVYGGPPRFAPIPGTSIEYAVNTHNDVLKIGNEYYACVNGAWFRAASPTGPWTLAESVPQAVATIPPASPLYRLTFVHVYAVTPVAITYGYTAGYVMAYPVSGVVVYGTGYYYPPVIIPGPVPAYYPYPYSYAGSVWYNPATGAWARGGAVYGPYGAARAGYAYNPTTGAWAGGAAVYGPYGGAGAWSAYNPSTGSYAHGSAVWGGGSGTANASW